ncbi:MAG TPA: hemin uptake protein HemP [Anaerolineae bacterium]|nr:hemin uptake protein HemP [Anaerolineae bacterium]
MGTTHRHPDTTVETTRGDTSVACLNSHQLFAGRKEVLIQHNGQLYRLRITRQNKLILTK